MSALYSVSCRKGSSERTNNTRRELYALKNTMQRPRAENKTTGRAPTRASTVISVSNEVCRGRVRSVSCAISRVVFVGSAEDSSQFFRCRSRRRPPGDWWRARPETDDARRWRRFRRLPLWRRTPRDRPCRYYCYRRHNRRHNHNSYRRPLLTSCYCAAAATRAENNSINDIRFDGRGAWNRFVFFFFSPRLLYGCYFHYVGTCIIILKYYVGTTTTIKQL